MQKTNQRTPSSLGIKNNPQEEQHKRPPEENSKSKINKHREKAGSDFIEATQNTRGHNTPERESGINMLESYNAFRKLLEKNTKENRQKSISPDQIGTQLPDDNDDCKQHSKCYLTAISKLESNGLRIQWRSVKNKWAVKLVGTFQAQIHASLLKEALQHLQKQPRFSKQAERLENLCYGVDEDAFTSSQSEDSSSDWEPDNDYIRPAHEGENPKNSCVSPEEEARHQN